MISNDHNYESVQNGPNSFVNPSIESNSESSQPWESGQPLWDESNKATLASNLAKNKSLSMALPDLRHLDEENADTDEETNLIIDQPWAPQNPAYESDNEVDVVPFVAMQGMCIAHIATASGVVPISMEIPNHVTNQRARNTF